MTNEEMERAMEFLLKNQAAFDARQAAFDAKFEAEREQTNRQIRDLTTGLQQTKEFLDQLGHIVAKNSQATARHEDIIERNSKQLNHVSHILESMAERQNRNSEELDVLVKLVGGIIERGNGTSDG